ncbi:hypothetical protein HBB16_04425 [Pseudonocardia sp. MCCB 268]|nr:hypothetical protein [Pseudonocardia cytotoxica]
MGARHRRRGARRQGPEHRQERHHLVHRHLDAIGSIGRKADDVNGKLGDRKSGKGLLGKLAMLSGPDSARPSPTNSSATATPPPPAQPANGTLRVGRVDGPVGDAVRAVQGHSGPGIGAGRPEAAAERVPQQFQQSPFMNSGGPVRVVPGQGVTPTTNAAPGSGSGLREAERSAGPRAFALGTLKDRGIGAMICPGPGLGRNGVPPRQRHRRDELAPGSWRRCARAADRSLWAPRPGCETRGPALWGSSGTAHRAPSWLRDRGVDARPRSSDRGVGATSWPGTAGPKWRAGLATAAWRTRVGFATAGLTRWAGSRQGSMLVLRRPRRRCGGRAPRPAPWALGGFRTVRSTRSGGSSTG